MLERISTQIVFMLFDASLKAILLWALAMLGDSHVAGDVGSC